MSTTFLISGTSIYGDKMTEVLTFTELPTSSTTYTLTVSSSSGITSGVGSLDVVNKIWGIDIA